jgi:hypothetical protein
MSYSWIVLRAGILHVIVYILCVAQINILSYIWIITLYIDVLEKSAYICSLFAIACGLAMSNGDWI